jgi:hypothetical protein
VKYEVPAAVKMAMLFLRVVTPYGLVRRYHLFGETFCLHLQGLKWIEISMFPRNAYIYLQIYTAGQRRRKISIFMKSCLPHKKTTFIDSLYEGHKINKQCDSMFAFDEAHWIERLGCVVKTRVSYLGGTRFKNCSEVRLSWLRLLMFLLSLCRQMPE